MDQDHQRPATGAQDQAQPLPPDISRLIGSPTTEEIDRLLDYGARLLESRLQDDPGFGPTVLDALGRQMTRPADAERWVAARDSVAYTLGEEIATLLTWIVYDPRSRIDWFLEHAEPTATSFVRQLFGLYGPDLAKCFQSWNEEPNDWASVTQDVLFSQTDSQYLVRFRLRKMNDEAVLVETRASGYLFLVTLLCRSLRQVDSVNAYDPDRLQQFREELKLLNAFFQEEPAGEPAPA